MPNDTPPHARTQNQIKPLWSGIRIRKEENRGSQYQEYSCRTVQPDKMIREDEGQNLTFEA